MWTQLSALSTLIVAIATVVLAVANGIMIWRERRRKERHRIAVDAKIEAASFQLIGELWHWTELSWPVTSPLGAKIAFARQLQPRFSAATHLAREMVEDAPGASPPLSEMARAVFAKISATTSDLGHLACCDSPDTLSDHAKEIAGSFATYRSHIEECEQLLEDVAREIAEYL